MLRKVDRNIESFLETETMAKKCTNKNTYTAVQMFDEFPLINLEDLKKMEQKLKNDKTFYSAMVRYSIFFYQTLHVHTHAHSKQTVSSCLTTDNIEHLCQ